MNLKDLGAKIAADHPQLNARVIDKVLRAAFTALRTELETTTESAVKCGPLGTFKLQDKPAKEGEAQGKRIVLRLSAAKDADAASEGKGNKGAKAGKAGKTGKAGQGARKDKAPVDAAARTERKAARQAARAAKKDSTPDTVN